MGRCDRERRSVSFTFVFLTNMAVGRRGRRGNCVCLCVTVTYVNVMSYCLFFFEGCLIETSSMPLKDDTSRKIVAAESLFISLKGRGLALFFFFERISELLRFCICGRGGEGSHELSSKSSRCSLKGRKHSAKNGAFSACRIQRYDDLFFC